MNNVHLAIYPRHLNLMSIFSYTNHVVGIYPMTSSIQITIVFLVLSTCNLIREVESWKSLIGEVV